MRQIKIIEAPRDAMQGIKEFIPTQAKIDYINSLLKVGFDTIDFGSFVSPKAIPQLADTLHVLENLEVNKNATKLLAIVGNSRGAGEAAVHENITYIGYPFSISETFLNRNINSTIEKSSHQVDYLLDICSNSNKQLVVYISMAFGNPYSDPWNVEIVSQYTELLINKGVSIIALSDTVGKAEEKDISEIFRTLIPAYPKTEFGLHLHTTNTNWYPKVDAAYKSGCVRFDTAIGGLGGCPMATDDLTGNLSTENLLSYMTKNGINPGINDEMFENSLKLSRITFPKN